MERLNFANKKIMLICAGLIIAGIVSQINPFRAIKLHHIPAFSYLILIILWAVTVKRRIIDTEVRNRVLIACAFMVMLFFFKDV